MLLNTMKSTSSCYIIALFTCFYISGSAQNVAVNTSGTAAVATNMFEVTQTSAAANMVAIYAINSGATAGTGYGLYSTKTGAGTTNVAGYFSATGGTNNYAGIFDQGFVGIGTTTPAYPLHVYNNQNAGTYAMIQNANVGASAIAGLFLNSNAGTYVSQIASTAAGGWAECGTTANGGIYYDIVSATGDYIWRTTAGYTERMRLTNAGNVGIGNPAPSYKLDVNGDIRTNGGSLYAAATAGETPTRLYSYSNANSLWMIQGASQALVLSDAVDYDRGLMLQYTPGVTGAVGGVFTIGQLYKNNAAFTHGVTAFYTNGLERMRVTSAGNVGIGTTTANVRLTVKSPAANTLAIWALGTNGVTNFEAGSWSGDNGAVTVGDNTGTRKVFLYSAGDSYFTGGNLCVGTTSAGTFPSPSKVTIQTSSAAGCLDGVNINNGAGGGHIFLLPGTVNVQSYNNMTKQNDNAIIYNAGGSLTLAPWTGGPSGLRIEGNSGLVGIGLDRTVTYTYKLEVSGTTQCSGNSWTSDIRRKKNIQPLQLNGLDVIRKLNPVTYEWKEVLDPGMEGSQMGFIAQEIERIVPTMVLTKNDSLGSKGVKYIEMIPILVKAIQEQQGIITKQQSDMDAIKAENQEIKAAMKILLKQNNLSPENLTGATRK